MAWSRGHGAAISDSDGKDDDNDDDDGSTKGRGGGAVGELAKYAVPRLCACEERKRRRGKAMAASEVVKIARTTRDSAWHLFRCATQSRHFCCGEVPPTPFPPPPPPPSLSPEPEQYFCSSCCCSVTTRASCVESSEVIWAGAG